MKSSWRIIIIILLHSHGKCKKNNAIYCHFTQKERKREKTEWIINTYGFVDSAGKESHKFPDSGCLLRKRGMELERNSMGTLYL